LIIINTKVKSLILGVSALVGMGVAMTTTASANTKYTVKSGDSLWKIANEHGTNVSSLVSLNQSKLTSGSASYIYPGDILEVGKTSANTYTYANNQNYNVQSSAGYTANTSNTSNYYTKPQTSQNNTTVSSVGNSNASGSTYSQFIQAGGTKALWDAIVVPESGGNPSASNGQYHGLGQTNQSWGSGSVASQTKGMISYANSRYGSVANAVSYRQSHNMW